MDTSSWVGDVERIIRARWPIGEEFGMSDAYSVMVPELTRHRPEAKNVEARIRDALQTLRRQGVVERVSPGRYRLIIRATL